MNLARLLLARFVVCKVRYDFHIGQHGLKIGSERSNIIIFCRSFLFQEVHLISKNS